MSAMKTINKHIFHSTLSGLLILIFTLGCERKLDDLVPASYPNTAEIFIDGFSAGLEYAAGVKHQVRGLSEWPAHTSTESGLAVVVQRFA